MNEIKLRPREILFRGKQLVDGEWVQGSYVSNTQYPAIAVWDGDTLSLHPVNPQTVGQYTGQLDRNGKKIFEGDILRWTAEDGESGKVYVKFDGGFFGLYCCYAQGCEPDLFNDFLDGEQPLEVIGNIHDTPELMWRDEDGE